MKIEKGYLVIFIDGDDLIFQMHDNELVYTALQHCESQTEMDNVWGDHIERIADTYDYENNQWSTQTYCVEDWPFSDREIIGTVCLWA